MSIFKEMEINRITLSFPKENEKEYQSFFFKDSLKIFRVALVFVTILYGVFGILDEAIVPQYKDLFHLIRFAAVIPFLLIVLLLSLFGIFERIWQWLLFISFILGGTGIALMVAIVPENFTYFAGLVLVFSSGYFFIRLRFFLASIAGWTILILVNVFMGLFSEASSTLIVAYNFFYISANLINMLAAYYIELFFRRNYFLNLQLTKNKIDLEKSNLNLESEVKVRTRELAFNEKKYRQLVEDINDVLYSLDRSGRFIFISPVVESITGYLPSDYIGKHYSRFINPLDINTLSQDIQEQRNYDFFSGDYRIITKEGKNVWIRNSVKRLFVDKDIAEYRGILRDITENKNSEIELFESRERFRELIELAVDGVLIGSYDGYIIDANSCICDMLGRTRDELIGLHIGSSIFTTISMDSTPLQFDRLRNGEVVISERNILRPNGTEITIEMRTKMMPDKTYQSFFRDVTERKIYEESIRVKNIELAELNASKDKFFSIISHDLRTPFSGFLGLSKLLAENIDDFTVEELNEISSNLNKSAISLYKLLENLLEWSRIQNGSIEFHPEVCHIFYLVKQNIDIGLQYAKQKEINLVNFNITSDLTVYADIPMLNTVIRNLIANAVKFTPRGGKIEVGMSSECMQEIISNSESSIIYIKDSGIGIPKGMIDQLFKIDQKVSRHGTEDEPSTGLGLILCKEFVERHGGRIWVESEEGKGSTFYFTLPGHDNFSKA